MRPDRSIVVALLFFSLCACGSEPTPQPTAPAASKPPSVAARPDEAHLTDLRQLTFGGENAEAYWAWAGDQLILQARGGQQACGLLREQQ